MHNNIQLFTRNRWQKTEFLPLEEAAYPLYCTDFRVIFRACTPRLLKWNQQLLYTFLTPIEHYDFTLTSTKPTNFLQIVYEIDGEVFQESVTIEAINEGLPTNDYIEFLQHEYESWYDAFQIIAENDGREIDFEDFYDDIDAKKKFNQFKNQLETNEAYWFYQQSQQILQYLQAVYNRPKVKLDTRDELVKAAEIDIVTPKTVQHFMKDTTTWARTTVGRPMPAQLLKEVIEESFDVYENRFVFTFAYRLEKLLRKTIKQVKDQLNAIEAKMTSNALQIDLDILKGIAIDENQQMLVYQQFFEQAEKRLKQLYHLTRKVIQLFKELRLIHGSIRPNQVLLYNEDYNKLYKMYRDHFKANIGDEQRLHDNLDVHTYYTDEVFLNVLSFLQQMKYEPLQPLRFTLNDVLERYIFTMEAIAFTFIKGHVAIDVVRQQCASFEVPIYEIVLTIRRLDQETKQVIRLIPTLVQFTKSVTDTFITQLYQYPEQSSFIVYPAISKEDYDKQMPYEQLHKLLSLGTNFITSDMFQQYGQMKKGVFPLTQSSLSQQIFERLIRLQLFKLGIRDTCFMCGHSGYQVAENEYQCTNNECRCEWGVRKCKCGADIYKMQKKAKEYAYLTPEEEQTARETSDVDWLFEQESKYAKMSLANLCENAHVRNNFFAICPNCGSCEKESQKERICKRCDAKERCVKKCE